MQFDHYSTLDLKPGASSADVQRAFRRKAKLLHPDANPNRGATAEFQRIQEAYRVLKDARLRVQYDAARVAAPQTRVTFPEFGARPDTRPFCCDFCKRQTAQPRYAIYWSVVSNLVYAVRWPKVGMFCADCARKSALRASFVSSCFGWWSLPGLVATPVAIARNARGGERPQGTDAMLLWNSALLFYARGDARLAKGLARKVAGSQDLHAAFARNMVMCLDYLKPEERGSVRDAWTHQRSDRWKHAVMGIAVPVAGLLTLAISEVQMRAAASMLLKAVAYLSLRLSDLIA